MAGKPQALPPGSSVHGYGSDPGLGHDPEN
jgi:hypothetical protein